MTESTYRVDVLLFEDVEELDAFGPWEVLRMWQRLTERDVQVRTVSMDGAPVRCGFGLHVTPDGRFGDGPAPDLLVHPGGRGTRPLAVNEAHLTHLRQLAEQGTTMASVCTGAMVYAAAGLLDGRTATTHWMSMNTLRERHPAVDVRDDVRWVDDGDVVTSAGISAGIDMALHLVERLDSNDRANEVARIMEYTWQMTP